MGGINRLEHFCEYVISALVIHCVEQTKYQFIVQHFRLCGNHVEHAYLAMRITGFTNLSHCGSTTGFFHILKTQNFLVVIIKVNTHDIHFSNSCIC